MARQITSKEMYTDVNGNLIAQYYDPSIDDFVPFAEQSAVRILDKDGNPISSDNGLPVQLTGSYVLLKRSLNDALSAGSQASLVTIDKDSLRDYTKIMVVVSGDVDQEMFDVAFNFGVYESKAGVDIVGWNLFSDKFIRSQTNSKMLEDPLPIVGDLVRVRVTNNGDEDHYFDTHVWGVK